MKTSILVICAIALLSLVGWATYGQRQNASKTTWEYAVKEDHSISGQFTDLRVLGAEGWELVAVTSRDQMVQNQVDIQTRYYLKRQK